MKPKRYLLAAAIVLLLTVLTVVLGKAAPHFFAEVYPAVSQGILGVLAAVTGILPLPLWELGVALLAVVAVVFLIFALKKRKFFHWLSAMVLGGSLLLGAFVIFWGAGHLLPTKTAQILPIEAVSVEDLAFATAHYAQMLDEAAAAMPRDGDGNAEIPAFSHLTEEAKTCFSRLAEEHDCIPTANFSVKKLLWSELFGHLGYTGIFVPATGESTVSGHTYGASLPFTVCHEMAHRIGACAEEDANFIAFLACMESDDAALRYSGAYSAFVYCYNALHKVYPAAAEGIFLAMGDEAKQDVARASRHYKPYEGKVQEAAEAFNDTYLKAAGQEAGTASYGLVSDALVAWYLKNAEN